MKNIIHIFILKFKPLKKKHYYLEYIHIYGSYYPQNPRTTVLSNIFGRNYCLESDDVADIYWRM